jgi:NAD(P)-dependent dehydrogenase (short-subunit alcohol dehydrogenase family)
LDHIEFPLRHKVILITGATTGIGEATARKLFALGGRVILHGRNPIHLEAVINRILESVKDSPGSLDILGADFAVLQQVYEMAEAFKRRYEHLDVLINNAGAIFMRRQVTPDGLESSFAVNHLAHFLLTRQLLDILKASAPARVITVSSGAHFNAKLDFNNLQLQKGYKALIGYSNAKLCNLLFAYELARRFRRTPDLAITSNAVHPGLVATDIAKNNGWIFRVGIPLFQAYSRLRKRIRTPDQGAESLVYLAADPEAETFNGKYIVDKKQVGSSVQSYDHDLAAHLWDVSEFLVYKHVPALRAEKEARETAVMLDTVPGSRTEELQPSATPDLH